MSVLLLEHPSFLLHEHGRPHAERPERLRAVHAAVDAAGLLPALRRVAARAATDAEIGRVHAPAWLQTLRGVAPARGHVQLDPDTWMGEHTLEAALHAAGAAVQAVDLVLAGEARAAFCAVRPPGHHALRAGAMGFCLLDNVAIAAAHALAAHGLSRVAIADFDVHHGNGTEALLGGDDRVLVCQTFQHPLYPGLPFERARPNVVNCPLPAHSGGAAMRAAVTERWLPALDAFAPQLVLISAGFDAHAADPLAALRWEEADYAWLTARLAEVAARHAGGRVISVLEGGYDPAALGRSVVAHLGALITAVG